MPRMVKGAQQPVALNGNNAGLEPQYPPKAPSASHDNNNGPKTSKYSG